MGALECVARDVCDDSNVTLGQIISRIPGIIPPPLDQAIEKIWGYTSNMARHVTEGRVTDEVEAELVVCIAAATAKYLAKK